MALSTWFALGPLAFAWAPARLTSVRPARQTTALNLAFDNHDERTFIMVKPDGVVRGLAGRILTRFEDKGLRLVQAKFAKAEPAILDEHYAHIVSKPFYPEVFEYMTSAPVYQMVFKGANAVAAGRILLGSTDPMKATLGTVRGDFGLSIEQNVCHGSRTPESAEREINLWFNSKELVDWKPPDVLLDLSSTWQECAVIESKE